jgi:hypothetical protein
MQSALFAPNKAPAPQKQWYIGGIPLDKYLRMEEEKDRKQQAYCMKRLREEEERLREKQQAKKHKANQNNQPEQQPPEPCIADLDMRAIKNRLDTNGYVVINDILSPGQIEEAKKKFFEWINSNPELKCLHKHISPHGIFKHGEVGHQEFAWFIRTLPRVQAVFRYIWNCKRLKCSYDGACWMPSLEHRKELGMATKLKPDNCWTHSDQCPKKVGCVCVQGFVALTTNSASTLVVYEGSQHLHKQYCDDRKLADTKDANKDWVRIDPKFLATIQHMKRVLTVKAGSLVLWDSRTFHQNQYGSCVEERIVQYVCYLPSRGCDKKQQAKRQTYFHERRTTSHWPYPVHVNGKQAQNYGNKDWVLDYSKFKKPQLEDLMPKIQELI